MKKNYFFGMLAALLMVFTTANAQISSMTELYGTYKMTSTMTVTADGESLQENFTNECEVTIAVDDVTGWAYDAVITGFAGGNANQLIVSELNTDTKSFKIHNWGAKSYWGSGLYMSDETGEIMFGADKELWFSYNDETKEITVPDFSIILPNWSEDPATVKVVATFTNVKLTLEKAVTIEIDDISGEWTATAGSGQYSTKAGSTYPKEYSFVLTKTSEEATKHHYTMDLTIGDFAPVQLPATFDGVSFVANFDNAVLDTVNNIYLTDFNGNTTSTIEFTATSAVRMSMDGALCLEMSGTTTSSTGEDSIYYEVLQWWMDGSAKKLVDEYDWEGKFTFKAGNIDITGTQATYPEEFEIIIERSSYNGNLYVTSMFGDCYAMNQGGIPFTFDEANPKVGYITGGKYAGKMADGIFYVLTDANGGSNITVTVGDDGVLSISDFNITVMDLFGETLTEECSAVYSGVKGEAVVVPAYDFSGVYDVTATVESLDGGEYPTTFEMAVIYLADYDSYYITYFNNYDVYASNYGGIPMVATSKTTAEITTDKYAGTPVVGKHYLKLFDADGGKEKLQVEVVDGNLSIADFTIYHMFYDSEWNPYFEEGAKYTNVVAVKNGKDPAGIQDVQAAQAEAPAVSVRGGNVVIAGAPQQVVVFDAAGRVAFSGVTNCVSGLASGLHIVKVGAAAVKVNVK